MLGLRDTVDSLLTNLDFQKCVSVYTMPKTAARDIHGRYQYDVIMYLSSGLVDNKGQTSKRIRTV